MKKLFFLLATIALLASCDKDGQLFAGKDKLPPETQTGANTVGCLVNDKVFLPHDMGLNSGVRCFYQFVKGERYFVVALTDYRDGSIETVNVFTGKTVLTVGQTYPLNQGYNLDTGGGAEYYTDLNNKFSTNLINTGELKITRIDVSKSIVSGTFWFDAVNSKGEKVEIREGRFDWNY
jgi:hypothetical protein